MSVNDDSFRNGSYATRPSRPLNASAPVLRASTKEANTLRVLQRPAAAGGRRGRHQYSLHGYFS